MAKRAKAPSAPNSVQSHEDLIKAVAKKGEYDRAAEVSASVAERLITEIKEDLALQLTPLGKASKQLVKDIQGYAEAHRAELTDALTRKSCDLETGVIGWRTDPPSVSVSGNEGYVIAELLAAGLGAFVRQVLVIDKEAILATRRAQQAAPDGTPTWQKHTRTLEALAAVAAIKINVGVEKFFVTPISVPTPEMDGAAVLTDEVAP